MISYSYPPYLFHSGVGNVAENLVKILSKKNEVFIISGKPLFKSNYLYVNTPGNIFRISVPQIFHPRFDILYFRLAVQKVAKELLKKYDFDILHDHQREGVEIAKYMRRMKLRTKLLAHIHTCIGQLLPFKDLRGIKKYLIETEEFLNTKMLKTNFDYDGYIAVSKFQKWYSITHEGISKKIEVLYNPINTTKYAESSNKERKVTFCGFLGFGKRASWVIEAANELINKRKIKAKFVIIGGGTQYNYLRKLISKYRLKNNVSLLGSVPECIKIREYQTSLLFTLPSLHESYGQVIVEAMSCGTPALVSDNSAMRELVKDGENGLRFSTFNFKEYVDKMEYFLTNEDEAKKMGRAAREFVLKNASFEVIEKKLYAIYNVFNE